MARPFRVKDIFCRFRINACLFLSLPSCPYFTSSVIIVIIKFYLKSILIKHYNTSSNELFKSTTLQNTYIHLTIMHKHTNLIKTTAVKRPCPGHFFDIVELVVLREIFVIGPHVLAERPLDPIYLILSVILFNYF